MSDIRGGPNAAHRLDLEGAPDSSDIVGREFEEKQLARWLVAEARRFVVVHGLRGMGKTTLAAKVLESVSASFDHVVWRSLQGGLPRRDLVAQLTAVVAPAAGPPGEGEADFEPLLRALASTRCLLVLDNAESLLVPERSGEFLPQYAGFLDLFLALANRPHRSAVLVTTREKFAGELQASTHVRWLPLAGLKGPSVKAILENAGASLAVLFVAPLVQSPRLSGKGLPIDAAETLSR